MTQRYYSPTTKGFYSDDVHKTPAERPEDCIDLTEQMFRAALEAQEAGNEIVWNDSEQAFANRPPVVKMENIRASRNQKLKASDWTQGRDVPEALSQQWADYRQALRDIPNTYEGRPSEVVWPETP